MPTLTQRQRFLAALRKEPLDRTPVHFWNLDPFGPPQPERGPWYARLQRYARLHTDGCAHWRPAGGKGLFYSAAALVTETSPTSVNGRAAMLHTIHTPKGPLTQIDVPLAEGGSITHAKRFLVSEEDVERFRSIPFQPLRPEAASFQRLQTQVGERAAVGLFMDDALSVVAGHFDPEEFAVWCITRKREVESLLAQLAERIYAYVEGILRAGARPVFLMVGPEFATPPLLSPALFGEFVAPYDRPLVDLMHRYGCPVIMHCHGRLASVIEYIAEVGIDGLHPLEQPPQGDISLSEAKRCVGERITFVGNISVDLLFRGAREEVRAACQQALDEAADDGGLILAPAAAPYESPFSERSYRNYLELARTGGRYR